MSPAIQGQPVVPLHIRVEAALDPVDRAVNLDNEPVIREREVRPPLPGSAKLELPDWRKPVDAAVEGE